MRNTRPQYGPILVVRHGRPLVDRQIVVDREGYRQFWQDYEAGPLHPDQAPPSTLVEECREADKVFASIAPRSMETASLIKPDNKQIVTDPTYIEANLPPPPMIPGVRMKAATWNIFSRSAWWFGWADDGESHSEARARARVGAAKLQSEAADGSFVLLAAHGWINRMLRAELKQLGWRCVRDGGDSYWSARRFERRR